MGFSAFCQLDWTYLSMISSWTHIMIRHTFSQRFIRVPNTLFGAQTPIVDCFPSEKERRSFVAKADELHLSIHVHSSYQSYE